ncbi:MAG: class I SAM-dependent methyltransferase [Flavobacteriales bacterium]
MGLETIAKGLHYKDGIYFSNERTRVSYPEGAHSGCFQMEENSFWFKHRNACIVQVVDRYPPDGPIFDIGGGNGFVSLGLERSGYDAVLLEPGLEGALNAQKRGLDRIMCATLEEIQAGENALPAVGIFDVVEHIEDDRTFLKEIFYHLQEKGKLYLTVPAYSFLWSNEDIGAGHFRRYTKKGMTTLLRSLGFEICYSSYIFSFLPLPIFLLRSLPSRLGGNKNAYELNKYQKEHGEKGGVMGKLMNKSFQRELERIRSGKGVPFGSTVLVCAEKPAGSSV